MTTWTKRSAACAVVLALTLLRPFAFAARTDAGESAANQVQKVEDSVRVLQDMMRESDKGIPIKLLERSAGIAIIPDVVKAAFVVGGRHGKGLVCTRRPDGAWSDPAFIGITGGSVGWQVGVQAADIILVFRTARSIENFTRGKFTLGADVGLAAGPLGRSAEASTDAELKAEILSYSRSRGLYVGLSLDGASLYVDAKANENFYGVKGIVPGTIFDGKVSGVPEAAAKLRQALAGFSAAK
ncbi:MAG TPA: lipid-binding SYLF domain-containing protein [Terriglobales bacterium]|nr:lipid-binding SYLF domain-containing protein [Terriglobales bacterium]